MNYIKRLVVDNFQSHQHTEVEFGAGLNAIVGPSDHGKSALVRALRWVLYNEPRGTSFIRVGAKVCQVRVEFDDGTVVTRLRSTTGKNQYLLELPGRDKLVFEGFGSDIPAEISQATGVRKVQIDEHTRVELNLGAQLDGPFLLSENGAIRAKVIGQLGGVHLLDWAQRSVNTELRRLRDEESRIQERMEQLSAALKAYEHLPELQEQIAQIGGLIQQAGEIEGRAAELSALQREWQENSSALAETARVLVGLDGVAEAGERLQKLEECARGYREMEQLQQEISQVDARIGRVMAVITSTEQVPAAVEHLVRAAELCKRWSELSKAACELDQVAALLDRISLIAGSTQQLGEAEQYFAGVEEASRLLASCSELLREWQDHQRAYQGVCLAAERYQQEIQQQLQNFRKILLKLGRCPVCLGELDQEAIKRVLAEYR